MMRIRFSISMRVLLALVVTGMLVLAGCGGSGGGSGTKVTVGSKNDADGQLLGQMYALLLQHAGYSVTTKLGAGDTTLLDSAIKSGNVDVYPEFTGTALTDYKLGQTQNPHDAYNAVKDYYEKQFKITWLDAAFNLNDSYAICTSQGNASKLGLKSVADLSKQNGKLKIASQDDGVSAAINPVKDGYGVSFNQVVKLKEQLSFAAVNHGDVDLMVCYTTEPAIVTNNFVVLSDPKGVFPNYNPAPVVRDDLLNKSPGVRDALNPLASHLTTEKQTQLIKQVSVDGKTVKDVAQTFLQDEGLLPK